MNESLKTLFHPFEVGALDIPPKGARVLVVNAPAGFATPSGWHGGMVLAQDLRPAFLALERGGWRVTPAIEGDGYDVALVLLGRDRGRNELSVAEAIDRLRPGGLLVAAGGRTEGAASLRKRVGGLVELDGHASKNHGVVFWLTGSKETAAAADTLRQASPGHDLDGFVTAPGLFSHEGVDAGSRLLAESLPDDLAGRAADFGAGWGHLSVELSRRAPGIASIDLFEASFAACAAARRNMAVLAPGLPCEVGWCDLRTEDVARRYDVLVTNPPFHEGRAADPAIGQDFIRAAAAALVPGGRLYLVANRPLPYEKTIASLFARSGEICRDDRFKVLWARR